MMYVLFGLVALLIFLFLINIFVLFRLYINNLGTEKQAELVECIRHQQKVLDQQSNTLNQLSSQFMCALKDNRTEMQQSIVTFQESLLKRIYEHAQLQKNQLEVFSRQLSQMTESNEKRLAEMRLTLERQIKALQEDNQNKLEQMRMTVDEKLHATLEKRLGESFKIVGDRLELVHKGLGEMQTLASGVGDLKKVLTNIKTRGTWGEVQLGNLLEQLLSSTQYEVNVATKRNSLDRVEYAIKLPGSSASKNVVWMPIDAKFPHDVYQHYVEACENGDKLVIDETEKLLQTRIKLEAKVIHEKYLDPPQTTDFAIMFLPVEGLYAEIIRRSDLCEFLQTKYRVLIAGPSTLAALLNSLQMGFKTLAIEKRSSEVWQLLAVVKTEFGKFGDILDKTQKKLQEAGNTMETAARKSRTIERKLRDVEMLPSQHVVDQTQESLFLV